MSTLYLTQCICLLVEGKIAEPFDHSARCKLSSHFQILTMLNNNGYSPILRECLNNSQIGLILLSV